MTLDIPYCFWVSMITLAAAIIVSLVNFIAVFDKILISRLNFIIHLVGSVTILFSVWSVIGFGVAWIIQSIK